VITTCIEECETADESEIEVPFVIAQSTHKMIGGQPCSGQVPGKVASATDALR
jgi:hypothetical protein